MPDIISKLQEFSIFTLNSNYASFYIGMGTIFITMMGGYCYVYRRGNIIPSNSRPKTILPNNVSPNEVAVYYPPQKNTKINHVVPDRSIQSRSLMQIIPVSFIRNLAFPQRIMFSFTSVHVPKQLFMNGVTTQRSGINVVSESYNKVRSTNKVYKPRYLKNRLIALNSLALAKPIPFIPSTKVSQKYRTVECSSIPNDRSSFLSESHSNEPTNIISMDNENLVPIDTNSMNPISNSTTNTSSVSNSSTVIHSKVHNDGSIRNSLKRIDQSIVQSLRNGHTPRISSPTNYFTTAMSFIPSKDGKKSPAVSLEVLNHRKFIEKTVVQQIFSPTTKLISYNPYTYSKLHRKRVANRLYSKIVPNIPVQYTMATPFRINSTVRFISRLRKGYELKHVTDPFLQRYTNKYYAEYKKNGKREGNY